MALRCLRTNKKSYLAIKRLAQSIGRLCKGNFFLVNHFAACEPPGETTLLDSSLFRVFLYSFPLFTLVIDGYHIAVEPWRRRKVKDGKNTKVIK